MLVGIPASGKSSFSREREREGYAVLSSDSIRAAMLAEDGMRDMPEDEDRLFDLNRRVFHMISENATSLLNDGRSVVIDATNLNRRRRINLLREIGAVDCVKKCILFITPREVCLERNARRSGIALVPDSDMRRMIASFECPVLAEGWDAITPVISGEEYRFPFEEAIDFSQDNPHHSLTLYGHLTAARRYAEENGYSERLCEVAYYHDIGKLYVKEFKSFNGEPSATAHFYGHENYGAYLYLCEKCCGKELSDAELCEVLYRACLINSHMRPLNAWNESPRALARDAVLFGDDFIAEVKLLNKADIAAH